MSVQMNKEGLIIAFLGIAMGLSPEKLDHQFRHGFEGCFQIAPGEKERCDMSVSGSALL